MRRQSLKQHAYVKGEVLLGQIDLAELADAKLLAQIKTTDNWTLFLWNWAVIWLSKTPEEGCLL